MALHSIERKAAPLVVAVESTVLLARDRPDEQPDRQDDEEKNSG
jgi:hypothetical protein